MNHRSTSSYRPGPGLDPDFVLQFGNPEHMLLQMHDIGLQTVPSDRYYIPMDHCLWPFEELNLGTHAAPTPCLGLESLGCIHCSLCLAKSTLGIHIHFDSATPTIFMVFESPLG